MTDPLLSADREREALRMFRDYRWRVGKTIHDLGGYKGLADDFGPLGDTIEAALSSPETNPAPDAGLRAALRAALDNALGRLSDDDVMYDHPVAMSGEPMDPVLFVNFAALRAAALGRSGSGGGRG